VLVKRNWPMLLIGLSYDSESNHYVLEIH
jgi:hypothetical protein